jgi:hypothetical protein
VLARKLLDAGHALGIGGDLFDQILLAANRLAAAASAPFDSAAAMQQRVSLSSWAPHKERRPGTRPPRRQKDQT